MLHSERYDCKHNPKQRSISPLAGMWQGSHVPAILIEHSSTSQEAVGFAAGQRAAPSGAPLASKKKKLRRFIRTLKNIIYKLYYI